MWFWKISVRASCLITSTMVKTIIQIMWVSIHAHCARCAPTGQGCQDARPSPACKLLLNPFIYSHAAVPPSLASKPGPSSGEGRCPPFRWGLREEQPLARAWGKSASLCGCFVKGLICLFYLRGKKKRPEKAKPHNLLSPKTAK